MHPDVGVCSIGYDELIAVLLPRQQRGYAAQPAPGLWNGRDPQLSSRQRAGRAPGSGFRPEGKRPAVSIRRRPGVRIAHIGDVDAPEVGRIARDFRKRREENGADLPV